MLTQLFQKKKELALFQLNDPEHGDCLSTAESGGCPEISVLAMVPGIHAIDVQVDRYTPVERGLQKVLAIGRSAYT